MTTLDIVDVDYDGTQMLFTERDGTVTAVVMGPAIATFLRDCIQEAWQVMYVEDGERWGMSL